MIGSGVQFKDFRPQVQRKIDDALDMALGRMAIDIEGMAKRRVPVSNTIASGNRRGGGGHLQSSIMHRRLGRLSFVVTANKEYAAYQERGARRDGTHRVRRYSTPGTGKGWFMGAVNKARANAKEYFIQATRANGL